MKGLIPLVLLLFSANAMAEAWLIVDDLQGAIPKAPNLRYDNRHNQLCRDDARAPVDATDEALTAAGWLLWDDAEQQGDLSIRRVAAGLEGQCRPIGISLMVFASGLPTTAYRPAAESSNLIVALDRGTLKISQVFLKPGEPNCCGTGKRSISVVLAD